MMILIVGGTGTVGRHVVAELLMREVEFAVGTRDSRQANETLGPEVRTVPLDLDDMASVQRAVQSAEKLFLLTPFQVPQDQRAMRVIDAAREAGVKHVVRQSAFGADIHPTYSIGRNHREVELYLLASGLTATIVRPNHFMENTLALADTIRTENRFFAPMAEARISHIAAKDIGAVVAHILTNEGFGNRSFDLTGPEANSMAEVAEALSHATGQHITYVPVSEEQWLRMISDVPEPEQEALLGLCRFDRAGHTATTNDNVAEIINRRPQSYRAWVQEHAASFMQPLPAPAP